MPFLVEEDVALDPENIDLFGAQGIVFDPENFPDLVEEFSFGIGDDEGARYDGFESGREGDRF